jgi:hypothetical protein
MDYQELFNYMRNDHGVILLQTDMQEICNIVNDMQNKALKHGINLEKCATTICPCCGSNKTYKTDAIHCNRCAVTTEI